MAGPVTWAVLQEQPQRSLMGWQGPPNQHWSVTAPGGSASSGLPNSCMKFLHPATQQREAAVGRIMSSAGRHTAPKAALLCHAASDGCCAAPCGCSWPLEGAGELPCSANALLQHPAAQTPWREHLGLEAATAAGLSSTLPATCPPTSLRASWQRLHLATDFGLAWLSAALLVVCPPPANTSCQRLHLAPDLPRCLPPADQHLPTSCQTLRLT